MATFTHQEYVKVPYGTSALIAKMQAQGLQIGDPVGATATLDRVSYFRLRGYLYPYIDLTASPPPATRKYRPSATFEKAIETYCFDEGLRRLIFGILPSIEVSLRAILDSAMSTAAGHGFWYLQPQWFSHNKYPERIIKSLGTSFCDSSEYYAAHYHKTYFNAWSGKYKGHPPFWVIIELSTLGQLKEFFENLKEDSHSFVAPAPGSIKATVLDKMAHRFGASHYRELCKWVHVLRDARNVCAHHGRLWNRNMIAPPGVISKVSVPFPSVSHTNSSPRTNSVYAVLIVIRVMCKSLGIRDGIKPAIIQLFSDYPEALNHLHTMGMPVNWDGDSIWV